MKRTSQHAPGILRAVVLAARRLAADFVMDVTYTCELQHVTECPTRLSCLAR